MDRSTPPGLNWAAETEIVKLNNMMITMLVPFFLSSLYVFALQYIGSFFRDVLMCVLFCFSLFQHYKMYEFMFSTLQAEEIIGTDVSFIRKYPIEN